MQVDQLAGDSTARVVGYENGAVLVEYEDSDYDALFYIRIPTTTFLSRASSESSSVHVRIEPIEQALEIDAISGRYKLAADFSLQMKGALDGFHLALGLKADDYPLLLQIRGYELLVAAPIQSTESILVLPANARTAE